MSHHLFLKNDTLGVYPDPVTGALPPGSIIDGPRRLGLPKELHESSIIALAKATDGRMALLLRVHPQNDVELYESSPSLTGRDSRRPWARIDREQEPGLFTTSPTGIGYVKGQLTVYTATARDRVYARQNEPFNPDILLENPRVVMVELIQAGLEAASRANSVLAVQTAFARAQSCGIHASDLDMVAILDAYYEKTARSGIGEPLDPEANLALIEKMYQMVSVQAPVAHPNIDVTLLDPAIVAAAHEAYHAIADLGDLALARRLARDLHLSLDFENPSVGHPSQAWQGVADRAGWHLLRRHCPGFAGHGTDTPWRFTPGLVVDSVTEGTPWFNVETGVMSMQEAARGWRYVGRLDLSAGPAVSPWLNDRVEQPATQTPAAFEPIVEQRTAPRRRPG